MNNNQITTDTYMGRQVIKRQTVPAQEGDFQTYRMAEDILKGQGHIIGSMCHLNQPALLQQMSSTTSQR
jgi:hypothetical protein